MKGSLTVLVETSSHSSDSTFAIIVIHLNDCIVGK